MHMILLFHIFCACVGMLFTAITYVRPSMHKLHISYALAASTLASGTYLTIMTPSHLVEACILGLTYFAIVTYGIFATHRKLALQHQDTLS